MSAFFKLGVAVGILFSEAVRFVTVFLGGLQFINVFLEGFDAGTAIEIDFLPENDFNKEDENNS